MADRYWVNRSGGVGALGSGTGNWNDTNNWSATSGGAGAAGVPTASDNVLVDNSSAGNCTLDTTPTIINFTISSGYSGATVSLGIYTMTCTGNVSIASNANLLNAGTSRVDMTGAGPPTVSNPTVSNAFYNFDVSSDVNLAGDLRVTGGVLTIDINMTLRLHSGVGVWFNVYCQGSGNVLVLNGQLRADYGGDGNSGNIFFQLNVDSTVLNIPGGTNYGANNSYTATGIYGELIGAISGTFSMQGDIANTDHFSVWGDNAAGLITFNTNNYNLTTFALISFGTGLGSDSKITANFGSSTISIGAAFLRFHADGGSQYNLQSSTWSVPIWSIYPPNPGSAVVQEQLFDVGTSSVTVTSDVGEAWYDEGEAKFYNLTLTKTASVFTCWTAVNVANNLTLTTGTSATFGGKLTAGNLVANPTTANATITVDAATSATLGSVRLNGTSTYRVSMVSDTPGTVCGGRVTGYGTCTNVTITDMEFNGGTIDCLDPSNIDGGNNGGSWLFDDNVHSVTVS